MQVQYVLKVSNIWFILVLGQSQLFGSVSVSVSVPVFEKNQSQSQSQS